MHFKIYLKNGLLAKIEKIDSETIVSTGVDDLFYFTEFGYLEGIREDYELWVSEGNVPEVIELD
jgi:hypothetical protein